MTDSLVKCTRCGRVSQAISRADAVAEIEAFNAYYDSLDGATKSLYSGRSSLDSYACRCGGQGFIPASDDAVPAGSTIGAVLYETSSPSG